MSKTKLITIDYRLYEIPEEDSRELTALKEVSDMWRMIVETHNTPTLLQRREEAKDRYTAKLWEIVERYPVKDIVGSHKLKYR